MIAYALTPDAIAHINTVEDMEDIGTTIEAALFLAAAIQKDPNQPLLDENMAILHIIGHEHLPDSISAEIYCVVADHTRNSPFIDDIRTHINSTNLAHTIRAHTLSSNPILRASSRFFTEALLP